jgi:hypothetical protein
VLRERPRGLARPVPELRSLILQPALEFGRIRQEEAFEQTALVEFERAAPVVRFESLVECANITPQALLVDAHFLTASAREHIGAEALPQTVERLAQRGACVLLVEFWPEQSEQRVSAVKAGGSSSGEEREESDTLRLSEESVELEPAAPSQVQSTQQPKLDHSDPHAAGRVFSSSRTLSTDGG